MCGITGIYNFDSSNIVSKELLIKASNTIAHRGPDGEGYFTSNNIGLAHRRLSIIDLSEGGQPMKASNGDVTIVFNGEIYNYIELRNELTAKGHIFKTNSDTEVILNSYLEWGNEFQSKLNGMWAIAIWNESLKKLIISRDRIGEKPLYYYKDKNKFAFGSEIKSILQYDINTGVNNEVLDLYLHMGYVPAPYSFYKNIFKLNPGEFIEITSSNVVFQKYWDLPDICEKDLISDKKSIYSNFESLLEDSVKIRMRADVPFGAFLSGGLDSASIVALMSENSNFPIKTFTIGFNEKQYDERDLARAVAKLYNTDHTEFIVSPESYSESVQKVLNHYDEPFGDSSAIPTNFVSKCAAKHVKMVLTGDGGDEVLSGYTMYQGEKFANAFTKIPKGLRAILPKVLQAGAKITSGSIRYKLNRYENLFNSSNLSFRDRLITKLSWMDAKMSENIKDNVGSFIKVEDFVSDVISKSRFKDPFYQLMNFQLKVSLPDNMLCKVDRMSMANSIETRVPFIDHRLVEYMYTVNKEIKMEGYTRKSILRNTVANKLPQSLLNAPKKGFSVPLREWFKDKEFDNELNNLANSNIGISNTFLSKIIQQNKSGKKDYGTFIWSLIILKKWRELNEK